MLKLKYLFDNRDLALMLLSNWEYNKSGLDIMDYFRISANAVYPFQMNGQTCFLRFAPLEDKQPQVVQAELDYLRYLQENGTLVPEAVASKHEQEVVVQKTPWGEFTAVVFTGVAAFAQRLDQLNFSDNLYYGYGETLGNLHNLSRKYTPKIKRPDWLQNLRWTADVLREYNAPVTALKEVSILEEYFTTLPATVDNYGLVHYDFELDNVFYNEATSRYSIIDFDDSMYHWYGLDIEQSVCSIKDELPENLHEQAVSIFLNGYRSVTDLDDSNFSYMPMFRRYVDLFGYARCLRSLYEKWDNEPEWMLDLRKKTIDSMRNRSKSFENDFS